MRAKRFWFVLVAVAFLFLQSFHTLRVNERAIPEDVNEVLQTSCFGCHNSNSRNEDARKALNLETWDDYSLAKKIGLLGDIHKVVKEEKMPPARFLESNPDRKPTDEQRKLIIEWTDKESQSLMEGVQ